MNANCVTAVLLLWSVHFSDAWDPDAGLVTSLTKLPHVTVTAISGVRHVGSVLGTSLPVNSSCPPSEYHIRPEFNILLGLCNSTIHVVNIADITDGTAFMGARVRRVFYAGGRQMSQFSITLPTPLRLASFAVDGASLWPMSLNVTSASGDSHVQMMGDSVHYGIREVDLSGIAFSISSITLQSRSEMNIREIGALVLPEYVQNVMVDLGSTLQVSTIHTRRMSDPNATYVHDAVLQVSADGATWTRIAAINTSVLHDVTSHVSNSRTRFISLEYLALPRTFDEIYCWEIDAWDEDGPFGTKPKAAPQNKTLRELLGVNGIWGWGHDAYSITLPPGEGPERYIPIATHARNLHDLNWDVSDPDNNPNFTAMAVGHETQATHWLNWDEEYTMWKKAGMFVDASIQFSNFSGDVWSTPEQSAYNYGRAFANHFGSVSGNRLVDALEVGNEPWNYDAKLYRKILQGMTAGVRSVDDKLVLLPGAFQADDKFSAYSYIGTRVTAETSQNISAINTHQFSYCNHKLGITYPEDEHSTFNSLRNIIRWRDANLPGTPIWVTEWGWDADGVDETCRTPECVSESAQAIYGIRGLLILARSGVERATWYSYANSDKCDTMLCRSGLTASRKYHFQKKSVFSAFEKLLSHIGDTHFLSALKEDKGGYVYLFGPSYTSSKNAKVLMQMTSHIVGWLPFPQSSNAAAQVNIELPIDVYPFRGWRFTGSRFIGAGMDVLPLTKLVFNQNNFTMYISTEPAVIELRKVTGGSMVG